MTLTLAPRSRVLPTLGIQYADEDPPLGFRVVEACRYPREYQDWELGPIGRIVLPKYMTQREWDFLMQWLDLTRETLVSA